MYEINCGNSILRIIQGDITKQETDAVVNAANKRLAPGGGVAGAIHRAAGVELWEECKKLDGCETGESLITKGYNLPAKWVIHTVGPIYSGSDEDPKLLSSCYENSLKVADKEGIQTISFPAISTGAFGYPMREATRIAVDTVCKTLKTLFSIRMVQFVLFDLKAYDVFEEVLKEVKNGD